MCLLCMLPRPTPCTERAFEEETQNSLLCAHTYTHMGMHACEHTYVSVCIAHWKAHAKNKAKSWRTGLQRQRCYCAALHFEPKLFLHIVYVCNHTHTHTHVCIYFVVVVFTVDIMNNLNCCFAPTHRHTRTPALDTYTYTWKKMKCANIERRLFFF